MKLAPGLDQKFVLSLTGLAMPVLNVIKTFSVRNLDVGISPTIFKSYKLESSRQNTRQAILLIFL